MKKFWLSEPVLSGLCALFVVSAVVQGVRWWRAGSLDQQIAAPATIDLTEETRPELIFAAARWKDEHGDYQQALSLYSSVQHTGGPDFQARVSYNMGTIYLREAARLWHAVGVLEYARVNTLVQQAKESYQAVLRIDPENWNARFNLEYAFRITPPPKERPKADFQGSKTSVFSTLPTLPGGGP